MAARVATPVQALKIYNARWRKPDFTCATIRGYWTPESLRPSADDFLANYYTEENFTKSRLTQPDPNERTAKQVYEKIGGDIAKELQHPPPGGCQSCALRVSLALNRSGYPIPWQAAKRYSSFDTDPLGNNYISRAEHMDDYLQRAWGPADITIEPKGDWQHETEQMFLIQKSLAPGEIAVFSRPGHTGIITSTYMDESARLVTNPVHIYFLKPKPPVD